jgi:hypothetical protein
MNIVGKIVGTPSHEYCREEGGSCEIFLGKNALYMQQNPINANLRSKMGFQKKILNH